MNNTLVKRRIEWIDCAKGITMLLVILGHSVFGVLRGAIFSFHMPLFFILGCMTYRLSTDGAQLWKRCKKAFVHLVVPALVLFVLAAAGRTLLAKDFSFAPDYWKTKALSLLFASGSQFWIGTTHIERMGIPWFLIVLFTGRTLFDLMHLKLGRGFVPACVLASVAGVVIGQHQWLPLSFDVTLASLIFLLLGYWLRKWNFENHSWLCLICVGGVWAVSLLFTELMDSKYLEMSLRRYPLYPLCLLTAMSGTMLVAQVSSLLTRYLGWLKKPLMFLGEHSLDMLCVHTMDFLWERLYTGITSNLLICAFIRIVVDLVIFSIVVFLKKRIGKRRCKNEV